MKKIVALLTIWSLLGACGNEELKTDSSPAGNQNNNEDSAGKSITPPKGYYDAALLKRLQLLGESTTTSSPYLYIAFDGVSMSKGFSDNQSFLLCDEQVNVTASDLSVDSRDAILEQVRNHFQAAMPELQVSDVTPSMGEYTTIVLTESLEELGCAAGVERGIAPFDVGNVNTSDIGFVFLSKVKTDGAIADEIIAQAGQTFGYNSDGTAIALNNQPLPGLDIIAGFGKLLADIQNEQKVDISTLLSSLDKVFPGGLGGITNVDALAGLQKVGGLENIEDIITIFGLATGAAQNSPNLLGANLSALDITQIIALVGQVIAIFADPNAGGLQKLLSLLSIGGIKDVLSIFQKLLDGIFGNGGTSPFKLMPVDKLPDFSILLGLVQYADVPNLLNGLNQHAALIQDKFDGQEEIALMSMLKVAYSQAYAKLK